MNDSFASYSGHSDIIILMSALWSSESITPIKFKNNTLFNLTVNDFFKKYTFYTDYSEGKSRDFFKVNNYKELSEFYEKYELNVGGVLKPEEVTNKGKGLVDFLSETNRDFL